MRKEDFVLTDFLLIQKMKQGNEQAFNTFVRKYYNEILSIVVTIVMTQNMPKI